MGSFQYLLQYIFSKTVHSGITGYSTVISPLYLKRHQAGEFSKRRFALSTTTKNVSAGKTLKYQQIKPIQSKCLYNLKADKQLHGAEHWYFLSNILYLYSTRVFESNFPEGS